MCQAKRWLSSSGHRGSCSSWQRLTLLRRVNHGDLAEGTFALAVVSLDLHLEGSVGSQAVVEVDVAGPVHVGHVSRHPRVSVLLPEGQVVAEAVTVLVLPGHWLPGANKQTSAGRGADVNVCDKHDDLRLLQGRGHQHGAPQATRNHRSSSSVL